MDRTPLPPAPPAPTVFAVAKPSATFVQADRSTFKELVQRLTGQTAAVVTNDATARRGAAVPRPLTAVRKPAFKPAQQHRAKLTIVRPERRLSGFVSPKALSQSSSHVAGCILNKAADLPSPASASMLAEEVVMDEAEEKAVKERRLCLHPSSPSPSRSDGGASEPKLLTLFPLTSPYSKESSELRDI